MGLWTTKPLALAARISAGDVVSVSVNPFDGEAPSTVPGVAEATVKPDVLELCRRLLSGRYTVTTVASAEEGLQRIGPDRLWLDAELPRSFTQIVVHEQRYVLLPLPEARHADPDSAQTVVEVRAKGSLLDGGI